MWCTLSIVWIPLMTSLEVCRPGILMREKNWDNAKTVWGRYPIIAGARLCQPLDGIDPPKGSASPCLLQSLQQTHHQKIRTLGRLLWRTIKNQTNDLCLELRLRNTKWFPMWTYWAPLSNRITPLISRTSYRITIPFIASCTPREFMAVIRDI